MRRLLLVFVLVGALAGCSSGSSDKASSAKATSAKTSSSTTPKAGSSPTPKAAGSTTPKAPASTSKAASGSTSKAASGKTKVVVGSATSFCAAFKEMQSVKASDGAAKAGAAYVTVAAEMRKYAPAAIQDAAKAYADVINDSGKALKSGTMPTKVAATPKDLAKVTVWVTKNCK